MNVEWRDHALCAQIGGDLWFPDKGGSSLAAIAVCRSCPVATECLEFSTTLNPDERQHGIWGGLSPVSRRLLHQTFTCTQCHSQYTPTRKGQKLCSDECRAESRKATYAKAKKRHVA